MFIPTVQQSDSGVLQKKLFYWSLADLQWCVFSLFVQILIKVKWSRKKKFFSILVGIKRLLNVTQSPKLLLYDIRLELCVCCSVLSSSAVSDTFVTPWTAVCQDSLLCSWGFSRQEYWSGCHALLQGIFSTQGLNPGLSHCMQILYHLSQTVKDCTKTTSYCRFSLQMLECHCSNQV